MAYIILNKNNFFNNLDIIAKQTKTKDKIALVLKDNAYGHGLVEMAGLAKEYGITKAVVQNTKEAKEIEDFFEYILVLAEIPKHKSKKIRYTINDINSIVKFPSGTLVELKVDTGMHRNGIAPIELQDAMLKIKEQGLILEAVFTHHRSADELTSEWFWQKDVFENIKKEVKSFGGELNFKNIRFHSSNSASLFRDTNFGEDMARVGISAYGCMQLPQALNVQGFKPVLSLYAEKNSSREIKKGNCVGYGGAFEAQENITVSNYDFGYGDGFLRACSNNYVTPKNKKQIGKISMDNSSFVSDEDELLIFEDARDVAKSAKTIAYEVLTSLNSSIKRAVLV